MKDKIESKRIGLFLLFAFRIAWGLDLIVYLRGGLVTSLPFTLSVLWLLWRSAVFAPVAAFGFQPEHEAVSVHNS